MRVHIITDADLDGAGSLFCLLNIHTNDAVTYTVTTEKKFRNDILKWQLNDSFSNYDLVYICDLNIKDEINLVDVSNVVVFDHHAEHAENIHLYTKAKPVVKDYPSCALLIYHSFKLANKLTDYQKLLVQLISDYDSYTLKYPQSLRLNYVFWNYTGSRTDKFLADFKDGFKGFNNFQKNAISITENKLKTYLETATFFAGKINLGENEYNLVAGFFEFGPNEIASYIIDKYKSDIAMLINIKTHTVCFRKSKTCNVHLGKLASKLANGGGHEMAAGCQLNDTIINLTKLLQPC